MEKGSDGFISVVTSYGIVPAVPKTTWKEFADFQHDITKSIFEVLTENCFNAGYLTKRNPGGFFAAPYYWKRFSRNPIKYPLPEPVRFIGKLLEKDSFVNAVVDFNKRSGADWISRPDIPRIGGFLYSICFYLKPFLVSERQDGSFCVKPRIDPRLSRAF